MPGTAGGSALVTQMLQLLVGETDSPPSCWILDEAKPLDSCVSPDWQVSTTPSIQQLINGVNEHLKLGPVILLPPWGRLPNQRSELQEDVLLDCGAETAEFPLITAIPASSLLSRKSEKFRTHLFQSWRPTAIAYVVGGIAGVSSSFRVALLRSVPAGGQEDVLHIFETPPGWSSQRTAVIDDFGRNLRMSGGTTDFGYILRDQPGLGAALGYRDLDPRTAARREELRNYGSATTLGEVFDVRTSQVGSRDLAKQSGKGSIRLISGRDVLADGTVAAPNEDSLWLDSAELKLCAGDILVRSVVQPNKGTGFVLAEVTADDLPAVASSFLLTLSPKQSVSEGVRTFIVEYLRSNLARDLIGELLGININASQLAALSVPLPDDDVQTAIAAVQHAIDKAAEWRDDATELLASMFDDPTAAASRTRILTESRTLRHRIDAAEAIDDFGYKVRTLYPHPLALRWREIEAASDEDHVRGDHYRQLLAAGEVLLAYMASVGLAIAREVDQPVGALQALRQNLSRGHGPSLGDWVAILDELSGKRFSKIDDLLGLPEFRQFLQKPDVRECVNNIRNRRNDESHVRGVDPIDLPAAVTAATQALRSLLASAEFLVDTPLIIAEHDKWDELSRRGRVFYRQLSGDHPVVPLQSIQSDHRVEKNSLYLLDTERRLHLLRPFLTAMHCPVCRNLSTFHIDRICPDGPILKSLEHGHTTKQVQLRDPLVAVGLLDPGPHQPQ
jgi:hypothetical protein